MQQELLKNEAPIVDYVIKTDPTHPEKEGVRIGIKSVTFDGVKYYNIDKGDQREEQLSEVSLYGAALTTPDETGISPLHYWSQTAYMVLRANGYFTDIHCEEKKGYNNSGSDFDKAWGKDGIDLIPCFQKTSKGEEIVGKSKVSWSGLGYTSSLRELRQNMADSIANSIGRDVTGAEILSKTDPSGDKEGDIEKENALKFLNKSDESKIRYSIVTSTTKSGNKFEYNSFGLAFYDIHLAVMNGFDYVTALGNETSVEEAVAKGMPGVSYVRLSNDRVDFNALFVNMNKLEEINHINYKEGNTYEIINTITEETTFTFSEFINADSSTRALDNLPVPAWTKNFKITMEEMYGLTNTYTTSKTDDQIKIMVTNQIVPPHTVNVVSIQEHETMETLDYDCPVAIIYKVAIFSLSGDVYDGALTHFNTSQYEQKHFCALFGESTGDARTDLVVREVNKAVQGFEKSLDTTYGWWEEHGDGTVPEIIHALDWKKIFDDGKPSSASTVVEGDKAKSAGQKLREWLCQNQPMSTIGSAVSSRKKALHMTTNVLIPFYPLSIIRMNPNMQKITIVKGQEKKFLIQTFELYGLNSHNEPFIGFDYSAGYFVLINEQGEEISESEVVTLNNNPPSATAGFTLTALEVGRVSLKYQIMDGLYGYYQCEEATTNANLVETVVIDVVVSDVTK